MKKLKNIIFLKDVGLITLTAFGGPQAHLALFHENFVKKRNYLSESQLMELNALCQILPGPSSTQTLTAIAYKRGGILLALITLLIWTFPAFILVTVFAISVIYLQEKSLALDFMRFVRPVAIAFVIHSVIQLNHKLIKSKTSIFIFGISVIISYLFPNPYTFPIVLILGGLISSYKFQEQAQEDTKKLKIHWQYLIWYGTVFIGVAILGGITKSLPVRLFENFYRNGSLIFGGGQILVPALYNEFVEFKKYLTSDEFLSGYAFVQAIPGPVFSFSGYIGALSMRNYGILGSILGSAVATVAINLAGTFLIFFVLPFWEELKKYRIVKASLEGIWAASAGMMLTAVLLLLPHLNWDIFSISIVGLVLLIKFFSNIPSPYLVLVALIIGFL